MKAIKKMFNDKFKALETLLQTEGIPKKVKLKWIASWLVAVLSTFQLPAYADASSSGYSFVKAFLSWIFLLAGFVLLAAGIVILAQGVFGESSGGSRNTGIGLIITAMAAFAAAAIFAFLPAMPKYKAS